jgi:hypothetical protein
MRPAFGSAWSLGPLPSRRKSAARRGRPVEVPARLKLAIPARAASLLGRDGATGTPTFTATKCPLEAKGARNKTVVLS